MIDSMERRWLDYEEDEIYSISTLLDPRLKEVYFTSLASKKLLLCLLHKANRLSADVALSNTSIISDNENVLEDAPVKKKCSWASFDKEVKKKKANHQSSINK